MDPAGKWNVRHVSGGNARLDRPEQEIVKV